MQRLSARNCQIISIHAPREGGDSAAGWWQDGPQTFQSTPPARGATCTWRTAPADRPYFNPRPPRGGRRTKVTGYNVFTTISIHAPREGGDRLQCFFRLLAGISIHAPREGGDVVRLQQTSAIRLFQSTPPARGATKIGQNRSIISIISIHAPREGGDGAQTADNQWNRYFNPRPPRGGRRSMHSAIVCPPKNFNPRPPRGGRPFAASFGTKLPDYFNPRPPRGGRHSPKPFELRHREISIHAPREGGDACAPRYGCA